MTVNYIYEEKKNGKYTETYRCEDSARVYDDLAHELISKKINECRWIRSIKRTPLYNGFDRITVTYNHGGRRLYVVASN